MFAIVYSSFFFSSSALAASFDLDVTGIAFSNSVQIGENFKVTAYFKNLSSASNGYGGAGTFDIKYTVTDPDYNSTSKTITREFTANQQTSHAQYFELKKPGKYTVTVRTYLRNGTTPLHQLTNLKTYKAETILYGYNKSYYPGDSVEVKAKLLSGSQAISGKTISFAIPGASGTATTDSTGYARKVLRPSGAGDIDISFAGDSSYESSSTEASLTKDDYITRMQCGNLETTVGDTVSIWGKLEKYNKSAGYYQVLASKSVTLRIDGRSSTKTTNSNGFAIWDVSLDEAKTYSYSAEFSGDSEHDNSSGSGSVTVSTPR